MNSESKTVPPSFFAPTEAPPPLPSSGVPGEGAKGAVCKKTWGIQSKTARVVSALALIPAALPALIPVWLIQRDGINVPFLDEWSPDISGIFVKYSQHQLTFGDLWAQHNEHRLLVPRLIFLWMSQWGGWNLLHEMYVQWGLVCITSLLILRLIFKTRGSGGVASVAFVWFACNLLLFCPHQWENWLWGLGLANVLPAFCLAFGLFVTQSNVWTWVQVFFCALFSVVAMLSNGNGILLWPIFGAALLWSGNWQELRGKLRLAITWGILCAGFIGAYLFRFQHPAGGSYTWDAGLMVDYFFVFCGNFASLATRNPSIANCAIAGTVIVGAYLISVGYFWRKRGDAGITRNMLPWIAFGAFGFCNALLAAMGRSGFGPDQAAESRYVTFSLYLPLSLIMLIPQICRREGKFWIQLPAFAAAALILVLIGGSWQVIEKADRSMAQRREGQAAMLLIDYLPRNPRLDWVFPPGIDRAKIARELSQLGLLQPFVRWGQPLANRVGPAGFATGEFILFSRDDWQQFSASGWAIFPARRTAADAVFITVDDSSGTPIPVAIADIGLQSNGTAVTQGGADFEFSGWTGVVHTDAIPAGVTKIIARAWAIDVQSGDIYQLDGIREISLGSK